VNRAGAVVLVASVALMGLAFATSSASGQGGVWADDDRPIHVEGDSYAAGIAQALRQKYPGRNIDSTHASVGRASPAMGKLFDADVFHILSAGTNDAASQAFDAATVASSIERVLGPYASQAGGGSATKGFAVLVLPHSKMGGELGEKTALLRQMLMARIKPWKRLALVSIAPNPAAKDGMHFDAEGYGRIAADAMEKLTALLGAADASVV
jgi:hypothetical protein